MTNQARPAITGLQMCVVDQKLLNLRFDGHCHQLSGAVTHNICQWIFKFSQATPVW